jgi:hypothetical protein
MHRSPPHTWRQRRSPQRARFSRAGVEMPSSVPRTEAPRLFSSQFSTEVRTFQPATLPCHPERSEAKPNEVEGPCVSPNPRGRGWLWAQAPVSAASRDNMGTTPNPVPKGRQNLAPDEVRGKPFRKSPLCRRPLSQRPAKTTPNSAPHSDRATD